MKQLVKNRHNEYTMPIPGFLDNNIFNSLISSRSPQQGMKFGKKGHKNIQDRIAGKMEIKSERISCHLFYKLSNAVHMAFLFHLNHCIFSKISKICHIIIIKFLFRLIKNLQTIFLQVIASSSPFLILRTQTLSFM